MGNEAACRVDLGSDSANAKALLETEELILRGAIKARIPFREMQDVRAESGVLRFRWNDRDVAIHAGSDAAKWAEKIRNPKSVADKLGIKPGLKISVVGTIDTSFLGDREFSKRATKGSDVIFFAANTRDDLEKLASLCESLAANGALWVIRPKGIEAITENDVMSAGKAAGLVDVKVVRFSASHTAEKFVIPLALRP